MPVIVKVCISFLLDFRNIRSFFLPCYALQDWSNRKYNRIFENFNISSEQGYIDSKLWIIQLFLSYYVMTGV